MTMTTLKTALLDILHATGDPDFRPLIGGGYGIYLKLQAVQEKKTRTLLAELPEARSTNDIDVFLRTELLVDGSRLQPLKEALEKLGYEAIESAKFYQFAKLGPGGGRAGSLKVDLLAGPRDLQSALIPRVLLKAQQFPLWRRHNEDGSPRLRGALPALRKSSI